MAIQVSLITELSRRANEALILKAIQMKLSTLISNRKIELKRANPKSRDRIRHRLRVLEVVKLLRRKGRAA